MAAQCVSDLEAAVKAVKDEYGSDPKWQAVIDSADKAVSEAQSVDSSEPASVASPGQKAADVVHAQADKAVPSKLESPVGETLKTAHPEPAAEDKTETPAHETPEGSKVESVEHPKDMKGAAKLALLLLRKK